MVLERHLADYFSIQEHQLRKLSVFLRYFLSILANSIECLVRDVTNGPVATGPRENEADLWNGPKHDGDLGGEVMAMELVPIENIDFAPEIRI